MRVFCVYWFVLLVINGSAAISYLDDITLSSEQKTALDKLINRVVSRLPHDYMKAELYILKWLRTSDFNVDKAETRIIQNLEWRKERKMDEIHSEDWSDMWSEFKYYIDGRDKMDRSFLYLDLDGMDLRRTILLGKGERLFRYIDKAIDEACNLVRDLGKKYGNITRGNLIMNAERFNLVTHGCPRCVPFMMRIILGYQEHWPECLDKFIVVNAPALIQPIYTSLIPLVDQVVKQNVFIYGTNKKSWMTELAKDFDFNQLPPAIGGTKVYKGMEDE